MYYETIEVEFSERYEGRLLREHISTCFGMIALRAIEKSLACANTTGNVWNAYGSIERGINDILEWINENNND